MATSAKKNSFITADLDWAEEQLATWKAYIDAHPIEFLIHETVGKTVVTIQQQGTFLQNTMKNYLALLEVVDKLRERETEKVETRGKTQLSSQAEEWLKTRK